MQQKQEDSRLLLFLDMSHNSVSVPMWKQRTYKVMKIWLTYYLGFPGTPGMIFKGINQIMRKAIGKKEGIQVRHSRSVVTLNRVVLH